MKAFNQEGVEQAVFAKVGDQGLHGDVILTKSKFGADFNQMVEVKDSCLAYGEATGHSHKIFGDPADYILRECPKTKERHLRVVGGMVALKHQEHSPVILPPGDYKIGIQKEYDPFEKLIRRVAD
jgi:hypothetical protein